MDGTQRPKFYSRCPRVHSFWSVLHSPVGKRSELASSPEGGVCHCHPWGGTVIPALLASCRQQKLWICMEFCGAGSLQDIYQGQRKTRDPGPLCPPLSTSPISLCFLGTAFLLTPHTMRPSLGPPLNNPR